jgi:hypothetical protein
MNASVSALIVGLLLTLLVPATQGLGQTAGDDCRRQVDAALEGAVTVRTRPRGEIADLLLVLRNRPYPEAYDAGIKLLREPEFSDGRSLGEIVGVLGRPDLMYAGKDDGSVELYYNTNGGPLDLSFQRCNLIHKGVDTPPHWRGSAAELAALWSKARRSREWWLWHSMTGWISRIEREPADEEDNRGIEVDLDGGMFGETGSLSFVIAPHSTCRGQWSAGSAATGNGLVVTRGRLLSQYGPRYFPGFAMPGADSYQKLDHAFIDCGQGRTMRLEFVSGPGTTHGWGIGQDNDGALYRFAF